MTSAAAWQSPRRAAAWATGSASRVNLLVALLGLMLFGLMNATSGRLSANDGLGWDGRQYAHMVTDRLVDGNVPTQTRPLLPLLTRVPYRAGLDIITAFQTMNLVYAFALYLITCLVLDRYGVPPIAKSFFVATLSLSIATGRMFAFYPVQIDLGSLALVMLATYLALERGGWLAGAAIVLAVTAREFAGALVIFLLIRSIRLRRDVFAAVVSAVVAITVVFLLRSWAASTNAGDPVATLQTRDTLLANLELWRDPAFVAFFAYYTVTLVGGVTALLVSRVLWSLQVFMRRPELAAYTALIVAAAAAGNADIWRYLVFLLPVVTILFGWFVREYRPSAALLGGALAFTVLTQEPFGRMTLETYFRDWFPYYLLRDSGTDLAAFWAVWSRRFLTTVVSLLLLTLVQRLWRARLHPPADAVLG